MSTNTNSTDLKNNSQKSQSSTSNTTFDLSLSPFVHLQNFLKQAQLKGIPEYNGMSISTIVNENGLYLPHNRVVLLKGITRGGLSFFTNYTSHKGEELKNNSAIAATFWWPHLELQVRINGHVDQLTSVESDEYFASRPRLSQIGAWASQQSQELTSFDEFQAKVEQVSEKFQGQPVARPPHWGGYRIIPQEFDILFLKPGRLHERYVYHRTDDKKMSINSIEDYSWKTFLRFP